MTEIVLNLSVYDWSMGFTLENPSYEKYFSEEEDDLNFAQKFYGELLDYYPELSLVCDKNGYILLLSLETAGPAPHSFVKAFAQDFKKMKVPGVYSVPQLGLKRVKFSQVLEEIVQTYQKEFGKLG